MEGVKIMTLEQVAQQAMDYLDSVGVAADYKLTAVMLTVITDDGIFNLRMGFCKNRILGQIMRAYPQKSPA